MEWEVNKGNPDSERRQLNRVLEEIEAAIGGVPGGIVETITPGAGIDVDSTDPANPEVALSASTISTLSTALQPGDPATSLDVDDTGWSILGGPTVQDALNDANNALVDLDTEIGTKEPAIAAGTTAQFWRGDKVWSNVLLNDAGAMDLYVRAYGNQPSISFDRYNGTTGSPTRVLAGDTLGTFDARGYDGVAGSGAQARMRVVAINDWSATDHSSQIQFETTAPGSTTVSEKWRIGGNGNLVPVTNAVHNVGNTGGQRVATFYGTAFDITGDGVIGGILNVSDIAGEAGATTLLLYQPTVDGADTGRVSIAGGATQSGARGAFVQIHGNEHATAPGVARITSGTTGNIDLASSNAITTNQRMFLIAGGTAITPMPATTFLLQRSNGTSTTCAMSIVSGNATTATLNFGDTDAEDDAFLRYNNATGEFSWKVAGTVNVLRLTTAQLTLPSTLAINNNTTAAASTAYADRAAATYSPNSQSADYTLVAGDAGKAILHPSGDATPRTFTIPSNASVAYPLGTEILFINDSAGAVTIAINTDTLVFAGSGATGSRTLAQYGVARAIKITSTRWYIMNVANLT